MCHLSALKKNKKKLLKSLSLNNITRKVMRFSPFLRSPNHHIKQSAHCPTNIKTYFYYAKASYSFMR